MKNLIIITILLLATSATAQQFYAGAGATYTSGIGYYAALGTTNKLTDVVGYLGELQFTNQKDEIGLNSLAGTFAFRVFPIKKLSVDLGLQVGMNLNYTTATEGEPQVDRGRMDFIGGLQFQLTKKFGLLARYSKHLSDLPFEGYAQGGLTYTF